ncbi:MAG: hypothetical protein NZO16_07385 [Deltaproteobacteria bacterium]|nr:hypothetical protein [Deltaproteobacteria bacterium]
MLDGISVESFKRKTKLSSETVDRLIQLGILIELEPGILDARSATQFFESSPIEDQIEIAQVHCFESTNDKVADFLFGKNKADENDSKEKIHSKSSKLHDSHNNCDQAQLSKVETFSTAVIAEIKDSARNYERIIGLLVERINSLNNEKEWLRSENSFLRDQVNQLNQIVKNQLEVISNATAQPKFPLLSRIFQALGLERAENSTSGQRQKKD